MMQCAICSGSICTHGIIHIIGDKLKCIECGKVGINQKPAVLSLPIYQGKLNRGSNVWSPVCDPCYNKLMEEA